jgi:hypothetical protein
MEKYHNRPRIATARYSLHDTTPTSNSTNLLQSVQPVVIKDENGWKTREEVKASGGVLGNSMPVKQCRYCTHPAQCEDCR